MKKQKKPTALLIVLGIFVLFAAGINGFQNGTFKLSAPNVDSSPGERRETEQTTEDLAADTRQKMGELGGANPATTVVAANTGPKMSQQAEMILRSRNGRPLMAIDKTNASIVKPKPNEASISTQWYSNESRPE
ncbi:hypothetical protein EON79_01200 [bacterium]|nr:MAG: hypothetical protein EON79_01200 [bacterium]